MLKISSLRTILVAGTAAAALTSVQPAKAQSTEDTTPQAATPTGAALPATDADTSAQDGGTEILITGSRIRRDPNDSPLPLQIITTQELTREGISSPEQLVAYLSTNGSGADNLASQTDVVGGAQRGANGASFANLRGQGNASTLVLLNGRRVAAHGLSGSAVDINQVPFAAIERVEILKDGASAIYGTDAIGGVINFITRKDYTGFGVQGFTDITSRGDSPIYRLSAIAGYGDLDEQGFNIMGAVSNNWTQPLRASQRDFVNLFQYDRGLAPETRGTPFGTIVPLGIGPNTPLGTIINSTGANNIPYVPGTAPFDPGTGQRVDSLNVLNLPGREGCDAIQDQNAYDYQLWQIPTNKYACAWDSASAAYLQQKQETLTYLGRAVARIGRHELSVEVTGSDAHAEKVFSNLQLTPNTSTQNFAYRRIPGVNDATYDAVFDRLVAYFPELAGQRGLPLGYRWRCIECGPREITTDTETFRIAGGADGPLFDGWDYRVGVSYATSESRSQLGNGYFYRDKLVAALNTGIINPFLFPGQIQSQAAIDLIQSTSAKGVVLYGGKYSVFQTDASVSGGLFSLPGGEVKIAVGVDYRKEKYDFNGDAREATARPVIIAAPFDDGNVLEGANREIKAAYAEILFPIFDQLEVTAAGRIDDYSGFGTTTNPKVSIKFRPFDALMFRGSYNTAFRVPTFNQLFNGRVESPYTGSVLVDPLTCPSLIPSNSGGCARITNAVQFNGGNLDLGPETAEEFSAGVVIQPSRNFSASVDWWMINRDGTILLPTLQQLLSNYSFFEDRFLRLPGGQIGAFDLTYTNAGETKTQGIEVVLRGGFDALNGRFSAGLDGTYLLKKEEAVVAGGPLVDQIGVWTLSGDLGLRWKHSAFVSYANDDWSISLSQIFRDGYDNRVLPGIANGSVSRPDVVYRVDRYIIYNLSVGFTPAPGYRLTAGVKNLFDTDPPFSISYDDNLGAGSSWEPRVADPRGRAFTMSVDVKF